MKQKIRFMKIYQIKKNQQANNKNKQMLLIWEHKFELNEYRLPTAKIC